MNDLDRSARFVYWLHNECGYRFIGDSSYYKLTNQELRVLQAGFNVDQRERKDRMEGVEPGDRVRLQKFDKKLKNDREALTG